MAFDSVASLLFNVSADPSEAEENIARFRALLGTDLDQMAEQFSSWAEETFGKLETVRSALMGITAGVAALGASLAGVAAESATEFERYALSVEDASRKTGIGVSQMSVMKFAAGELNVNFDELVGGLTKFERAVFEAQDPTSKQAQLLHRMGFSTQEIQGAMKDAGPFLDEFAKRFATLPDGPTKTATAIEMMGRAGANNIKFLTAWAHEMEGYIEHARRLGIELSPNDVVKAGQFMAATKELHAEWEGFTTWLGRETVPVLEKATAVGISFWHTITSGASWTSGKALLGNFLESLGKTSSEIEKAAKAAQAAGTIHDLGPGDSPKVKEAAQDFKSLSTELDAMKLRLAELAGPEEKLNAELDQMRDRAQNAAAELIKLHNAGKLTEESWERESQAVIALRRSIGEWGEEMKKQLADKDVAELQTYLDKIAAAAQEL